MLKLGTQVPGRAAGTCTVTPQSPGAGLRLLLAEGVDAKLGSFLADVDIFNVLGSPKRRCHKRAFRL